MSYANATVSPADRAKAATTVIAVHALIGAGLVFGLAVTGELVEDEGGIIADDFRLDPPPPPPEPDTPPEPSEAQPPSTVTAPTPPLVLNQPTNIPVELPRERPTEPVRVVVPTPVPSATPAPPATPSPTPSIAPVAAVPRNGPQGWITNDDYSNSDLRREREGTARYRLVIGSNGRVNSCEIVQSTGHSSLDSATCRLIQRRAQFNAATDSRGERVVGTYTGSVSWRIPE